jgi:N-methylhydantoinase A/oxoprolinase/acetone carboxylase beta subunit
VKATRPLPNLSVSRIGVDTGGTFTDFVHLTQAGLVVDKRRSTPDDPSRAILEGLQRLAPNHSSVEVIHGSTVATNAVLERKGARVALLATMGFEDALKIGRQTRPELYNLNVEPRRPLVDDAFIFGVPERLDAAGRVLLAVDAQEVGRIAGVLAKQGVDIVAVCLLHSYANPAHELRVCELLRGAGLRLCASHQILPGI